MNQPLRTQLTSVVKGGFKLSCHGAGPFINLWLKDGGKGRYIGHTGIDHVEHFLPPQGLGAYKFLRTRGAPRWS